MEHGTQKYPKHSTILAAEAAALQSAQQQRVGELLALATCEGSVLGVELEDDDDAAGWTPREDAKMQELRCCLDASAVYPFGDSRVGIAEEARSLG